LRAVDSKLCIVLALAGGIGHGFEFWRYDIHEKNDLHIGMVTLALREICIAGGLGIDGIMTWKSKGGVFESRLPTPMCEENEMDILFVY
jgi:hypothetical protein